MGDDFEHTPVLLQEVLNGLGPVLDGVVIDGTFGRGGHSRELLKRLGPDARVLGIDRGTVRSQFPRPPEAEPTWGQCRTTLLI